MTLLHSWRSVGQLLIGVLVSTQVAIAAHACPGASRMDMAARDLAAGSSVTSVSMGLASPAASEPSAAADEGGGMEPGLSNVCVAHCQDGQRSADHAQPSAMPAVLAGYLYTLPPLGEFLESSEAFPGPGRAAPAAAGPPHTILHCCLRN